MWIWSKVVWIHRFKVTFKRLIFSKNFRTFVEVKIDFNQVNLMPRAPSSLSYRISSYSFRGNYSFLNLEIQRSQYIRPKVTVHKCAETIQGRKLFKGGNYMRKYGIHIPRCFRFFLEGHKILKKPPNFIWSYL